MIDELKQLYERATKGEWTGNNGHLSMPVNNPMSCGCGYSAIHIDNPADAAFIAAVHNAFPELIELAEWAIQHREKYHRKPRNEMELSALEDENIC